MKSLKWFSLPALGALLAGLLTTPSLFAESQGRGGGDLSICDISSTLHGLGLGKSYALSDVYKSKNHFDSSFYIFTNEEKALSAILHFIETKNRDEASMLRERLKRIKFNLVPDNLPELQDGIRFNVLETISGCHKQQMAYQHFDTNIVDIYQADFDLLDPLGKALLKIHEAYLNHENELPGTYRQIEARTRAHVRGHYEDPAFNPSVIAYLMGIDLATHSVFARWYDSLNEETIAHQYDQTNGFEISPMDFIYRFNYILTRHALGDGTILPVQYTAKEFELRLWDSGLCDQAGRSSISLKSSDNDMDPAWAVDWGKAVCPLASQYAQLAEVPAQMPPLPRLAEKEVEAHFYRIIGDWAGASRDEIQEAIRWARPVSSLYAQGPYARKKMRQTFLDVLRADPLLKNCAALADIDEGLVEDGGGLARTDLLALQIVAGCGR